MDTINEVTGFKGENSGILFTPVLKDIKCNCILGVGLSPDRKTFIPTIGMWVYQLEDLIFSCKTEASFVINDEKDLPLTIESAQSHVNHFINGTHIYIIQTVLPRQPLSNLSDLLEYPTQEEIAAKLLALGLE